MTTTWQHGASLYQGRRALGGHVKVANGKFEVEPHAFDRKTGGRPFSVSLSSITSIEQTARSWNPATFSRLKCLLIETSDGTEAKFLVNGLAPLVSATRGR